MLSKLFDFTLLERFMNWFKPSDGQSAYQKFRSCADNVFLFRCLISFAKKNKRKLFLIAVDFEGAFDRISREQLFKKLITFGVGSAYLSCLMAIYSRTEYIVFGLDDHATYATMAGIKQGSPLSPWLFLFYVDDIFQFFAASFASDCIYEIVHILMHADDAVLIASTRSLAILKLKHLLSYCKINSINLEATKSHFICVNGTDADRVPLPTTGAICKDRALPTHRSSIRGSVTTISGQLERNKNSHFKSHGVGRCIKAGVHRSPRVCFTNHGLNSHWSRQIKQAPNFE